MANGSGTELDERVEYYEGRITADEYLRRRLSGSEQDRSGWLARWLRLLLGQAEK